MSILALDWDRDTARVAVAEKRPTGAVLTRAVSMATNGDAGQLAEQLRAALPDVRWSKAKLVLAVGGDRVAFRRLELPPTPDDELPDMVQLLADREFGGGDGAVDFVPLSGDAQAPRTVLAARVARATLDAALQLADALDTTVARVVLRAAGAASAATRLDGSLGEGACLIVGRAGDAADLVVTDAGVPIMIRTMRGDLSADGAESRRTLSSASLQLGRSVDRMAMIGGEALSLSAKGRSDWRLPAGDVERLDGMPGAVGAALDEADNRTPVVDLLHPRRPTKDTAPTRRRITTAGLAAALAAVVVWMGYLSLTRFDRERADLERQRQETEQSIEKWRPYADRAALIDAWLATDVNWLDELEQLGRKLRPQPLDEKDFPADADVMLAQFNANTLSGRSARGGRLTLDAVARDADTPTELEERLRDDRLTIRQGSLDQSGRGRYPWRFKPTLEITAPAPTEPADDANAAGGASP